MINGKNRVIAILGGMGPDASARLYQMMIDMARDEFGARENHEYPEIIVHSIPVPDAISDKVKVKISNSDDLTVFDLSDQVFKIKADFKIISPNGSESWTVAEEHKISWQTKGTVKNVNLTYSRDEGKSWTVISDSIPNKGQYSWTVPDAISDQCRVRVSDPKDYSVFDASESSSDEPILKRPAGITTISGPSPPSHNGSRKLVRGCRRRFGELTSGFSCLCGAPKTDWMSFTSLRRPSSSLRRHRTAW